MERQFLIPQQPYGLTIKDGVIQPPWRVKKCACGADWKEWRGGQYITILERTND